MERTSLAYLVSIVEQLRGHGIPTLVHVWCIYLTDVREGIDTSKRSGTFRRRAGQGVGNPSQSYDVARVVRSNHETHSKVSRAKLDGCSGDDERSDGEDWWQSDVQVSFTRAVGVPGVDQNGNHADDLE